MYEPFFRLLKLWRNLSLSADLETERLILLEKHACLSYNFARICKAISQPLRRHKKSEQGIIGSYLYLCPITVSKKMLTQCLKGKKFQEVSFHVVQYRYST